MDGQGTVLVASPPELRWLPSVYVQDELVNGPIPWALISRCTMSSKTTEGMDHDNTGSKLGHKSIFLQF